uniref:Uncharacterized protein n=2 Tax=Aegilops tauschii subsp. strangulata TaxID=200361 RepID=A0A453HTC7_AEGTS
MGDKKSCTTPSGHAGAYRQGISTRKRHGREIKDELPRVEASMLAYSLHENKTDELNKSKKWAELHVADNCSFHYRRSLLLALLDGAANREDSLICQSEAYLMWKEELRWNETLIRRYQGRESLWNHRRFLSQWWVQHLLSCEETSLSNESLADLFLSQEIHLLSDCLGAPGDEFGETRVQQDAAVKGKVEERLKSVGSLKEVLARACPEKSRLWTHLLHC